jgi:hypothetical protein
MQCNFTLYSCNCNICPSSNEFIKFNCFLFCWPCIILYQYSDINVMHCLFNLFKIKDFYMFRALLADPQEALHKRHFGIFRACYVSWLQPTDIILNKLHHAGFTIQINCFSLGRHKSLSYDIWYTSIWGFSASAYFILQRFISKYTFYTFPWNTILITLFQQQDNDTSVRKSLSIQWSISYRPMYMSKT